MILPTKHLSRERALLSLGGEILKSLDNPSTISSAWESLSCPENNVMTKKKIGFDEFILALDLLYAMGAVTISDGRITKVCS